MRWSCKQYRALLPGYIERELSPQQRERVSRHLNACPDCYVAYIEQRHISRELANSLPRVGAATGSAPRFDLIRAAVMAEVHQPKRQPRLVDARFSIAALLLVVALLLPLSVRERVFALPTPTQPQPEYTAVQGTAVAAAPATDTVTLTATLQANYAPVIGATDTP
jgi:anti-sigma factor RsiW